MSVLQWAEERSQSMTLWDIGVLKIYCVLFGVVVGAYVPHFVTTNVWWFVAVVLVLGIRNGHRFLTAEPR